MVDKTNKEILQDFDESFIKTCTRMGISYTETQKALLESPQRKALVESIVSIKSTLPNVLIN